MNPSLLYALIAWWSLQYIVPIARTMMETLRYPLFPVSYEPLGDLIPPARLHQAAVEEIGALGFKTIAACACAEGSIRYNAYLLRHETEPAVAMIELTPSAFTAYPVYFWSFDAQGRGLVTANRRMSVAGIPNAAIETVFADNLQQHWNAHRERMQKHAAVSLSGEDFCARIIQSLKDSFAYNTARKIFTRHGENWFVSFPAAFRMALSIVSHRAVLQRPYQSAVKSSAWLPDFNREAASFQAGAGKSGVDRKDVALIFLALSMAASFALMDAWLNWKAAAAIIAVLFVHESGHALAMRAFGYRSLNMFFVPFMGAFVTGRATGIDAWKQVIVSLAGPAPGLLFGLWALDYMPGFADPYTVRMIGFYAFSINLFNLFPLYVLDGGRVIEAALISRWPYALVVFAFISCVVFTGLGLALENYMLLIIVLFIINGLPVLAQTARLRRALRRSGKKDAGFDDILALAKAEFPAFTRPRQQSLARIVYAPSPVSPPRPWETVFALTLFMALWLVSAGTAWDLWGGRLASAWP
jgi:Zn-dependent protease